MQAMDWLNDLYISLRRAWAKREVAKRMSETQEIRRQTDFQAQMNILAEELVVAGSPYALLFKTARNKTGSNRAARRVVEMIWMGHVWMVWRKAEGLPHSIDNDPAARDLLTEYNALNPADFGW